MATQKYILKISVQLVILYVNTHKNHFKEEPLFLLLLFFGLLRGNQVQLSYFLQATSFLTFWPIRSLLV